MHIIETFPTPVTKAGALFWLPAYVRLSQSVYDSYTQTGETSERSRHVSNCASRWGITRRAAEAILTGEATIDMGDTEITIKRSIREK